MSPAAAKLPNVEFRLADSQTAWDPVPEGGYSLDRTALAATARVETLFER